MSASRKVKRLKEKLVLLTPRAKERWSILVSMMELTNTKLKKRKKEPILLRPYEIDDKGHTVGSIRNSIDLMKTTSPPLINAHEEKIEPYTVYFTKESIKYLFSELEVWKEIKTIVDIDTLTIVSLQIISKVANETKRLFEGTVPKKT